MTGLMKLDQRSDALLREVYPVFGLQVERVLRAMLDRFNKQMRVTAGFRSFQEQGNIFAIGRSKPGKIVTKAKPGMSKHNYGLAVDVCFRGMDPFLERETVVSISGYHPLWHELEKLCKEFDLRSGLSFGDAPHIEWPNPPRAETLHDEYIYNGLSIEQIWKKYG